METDAETRTKLEIRHLLIVVSVSTALYLLLGERKEQRRLRNSLRLFPSPPTLPIIGNIHLVFGNGRGRVKQFLNMFAKYESPFVIWLARMPMMILTKGEHILAVSNKCVDRDVMGIFEESVGNGITVARAEKWRKTRRLINPAFGAHMLRQYITVFEHQTRLLAAKLEKEANTGRLFDLWPYMANANIDIITENITGTKLNTQDNRGNEFSEALIATLKMESLRLVLPWLLSPTLFYLYRLVTGNKDVFEKLRKLPHEVLQRKKFERETQSTNPGNDMKTLVDILFAARETNSEFTEKQIHDEMLNIIVTGSESTAVTASFVLLLLAMNPHIQEKVHDEIVTVLGVEIDGTTIEPTLENLSQLKYLEQCVKETLRIFTLFPLTLRKTSEEVKLNDERVIPPGCQVVMALHGVHLDSELYPNPTVWNPDNFATEAAEKRPKNSFLAFGAGPRSCIGAKYAMLSLKTQIARIVQIYRLETTVKYTDLKPTMDAIVRNKFGYPVKLELRKTRLHSICDGKGDNKS